MFNDRDKFYGLVLRHLTKQNDELNLSEIGDKAGHFRLDRSFLLVKYDSSDHSPWRFTFQASDVETLVQDRTQLTLFGESCVCLVCGFRLLCSLRTEEWAQLLDLDSGHTQQITVERQKRAPLIVRNASRGESLRVPKSRPLL